MLRRILLSAALAVLLAPAGPGLRAEGRLLSPGEMRDLSAKALDAGHPETALELTSALLQRDADDVQALLIRSRAARDSGDFTLARDMAGRAWSLSGTDPEARYAAALATAQALSSQGKRTRAQIWLRRAAQIAPTEQARQMAVRDFRYVRSRNCWATDLTFGIGPRG